MKTDMNCTNAQRPLQLGFGSGEGPKPKRAGVVKPSCGDAFVSRTASASASAKPFTGFRKLASSLAVMTGLAGCNGDIEIGENVDVVTYETKAAPNSTGGMSGSTGSISIAKGGEAGSSAAAICNQSAAKKTIVTTDYENGYITDYKELCGGSKTSDQFLMSPTDPCASGNTKAVKKQTIVTNYETGKVQTFLESCESKRPIITPSRIPPTNPCACISDAAKAVGGAAGSSSASESAGKTLQIMGSLGRKAVSKLRKTRYV